VWACSEMALLPISDEVEALAVPQRSRHDDYQGWAVGPKRAPVRLALAYATVPGMSFAGLADEEDAAVIDPDLFAFHHVDYAAPGHIPSTSVVGMTPTIDRVVPLRRLSSVRYVRSSLARSPRAQASPPGYAEQDRCLAVALR
jgi:hypothetical protein